MAARNATPATTRARRSRQRRRLSHGAFPICACRGDQRLRALFVSVVAQHPGTGALGYVPRSIEVLQVVADLRLAVVEVLVHHILFLGYEVVFGVLAHIA